MSPKLPAYTARLAGWVHAIDHLSHGREPVTLDTIAVMLRVPVADLAPALHLLVTRGLLAVTADGRLYPTTKNAPAANAFKTGAAA